MTKKQKEKFNKILNDKTSGSTEILLALNKFLITGFKNRKLINSSLIEAKKKLSHFAAINNYINTLNKLLDRNDLSKVKYILDNIEHEEEKKYEKIFINLIKELPKAKNILTISRSGTLIRIFNLWNKRERNLRLIIPESRPSNEGKKMAMDLLKAGLNVEIITDSMTGKYISDIDAVIIGADTVLKNGNVINKSGSLAMAVLCRYYKKPFYVLATKSKIINKTKFKIIQENPDYVWSYKHSKLQTSNIPFEEIECKLITKLITE